MKYPLTLLCVFLLAACKNEPNSDLKYTTYFDGDIITMDGPTLQYAEAVVTDGEEIVFVGSLALANEKYPESKHHLLKGNTMMPGFIEPHVHPSLAATILPNEIIAP